MVKTASSMVPLGFRAPDFSLHNPLTGESQSLDSLRGEDATLVMFICNHCPYVKHITHELAQLGKQYHGPSVGMIAVNSNDAEAYPDDSPENMVIEARKHGYTFPYLYDHTQEVARAYQAQCTPDFFIFDKDLHCVYRGQLCDSRPGNGIEVTGRDLRTALDKLLAGEPVPEEQTPSIGCNIKWKNA
jgi:peroxiredoxin